jgi:hypothetical protein
MKKARYNQYIDSGSKEVKHLSIKEALKKYTN